MNLLLVIVVLVMGGCVGFGVWLLGGLLCEVLVDECYY